jgi:hypothetical protein
MSGSRFFSKCADPSQGQRSKFRKQIHEGEFTPSNAVLVAAGARAAAAVNCEMVRLYWSIGERIRKDILAYERAAYGEQIVHALSGQLSEDSSGSRTLQAGCGGGEESK